MDIFLRKFQDKENRKGRVEQFFKSDLFSSFKDETVIFDLEIAFLFPWAISLGNIGILGFSSMMIFLFILTIGFIYEWKKGALDWE